MRTTGGRTFSLCQTPGVWHRNDMDRYKKMESEYLKSAKAAVPQGGSYLG